MSPERISGGAKLFHVHMPRVLHRGSPSSPNVPYSTLSLTGIVPSPRLRRALLRACNQSLNCGSFVFRCEMGVSQCHLDVRVAQEFPNRVEINSSHHELACERVAEIVEAKIRDRFLQNRLSDGRPHDSEDHGADAWRPRPRTILDVLQRRPRGCRRRRSSGVNSNTALSSFSICSPE